MHMGEGVMESPVGHDKDSDCYSKRDGKPLRAESTEVI